VSDLSLDPSPPARIIALNWLVVIDLLRELTAFVVSG
jgi:hypothetical protein